MLIDTGGPDILRVELGSARSGDPLNPSVILSGDYLANTAMFFTRTLSPTAAADGRLVDTNTINYGKTFNAPPIAFVTIKLSAAYGPFGSGDFISPCLYSYFVSNQGYTSYYSFEFQAFENRLVVSTTNFRGTIYAYVVGVN